MKKPASFRLSPQKIASIAFMSAMLIGGKFALSFVPNVEVVTLFTVVFSYVFGYMTMIATFVFCTIDFLIYPTSIDVIIAYYIYWQLLAYVVALCRKKVSSPAFYTAVAVLGTFVFGVLTTATCAIFYKVNFFMWYASGIVFFAIHMISALVTVGVGFRPLTGVLSRLNAATLKL